jgi:hypothetical protein
MVVPELNCFMIWIMKNPTLIVYIHTPQQKVIVHIARSTTNKPCKMSQSHITSKF